MLRNDTWELNYREVMLFIEQNKHRPSKYKGDERRLHNWLKYNKKMLAANKMPPERMEKFNWLLGELQEFQRLNQYAYKHSQEQQFDF